MNALPEVPGLVLAAGPDDPRLHDTDADFRRLLDDFAEVARASRASRRRFFHAHAAVLGGELECVAADGPPVHPFLAAGRRHPVIVRYSNGETPDDAAPATRGLSLLVPGSGGEGAPAPFNLTLNTGECLFAPNAWVFARFLLGTDAQREALVHEAPERGETLWRQIRGPLPYDRYVYHSQAPRLHIGADGRPGLVRYRAVPAGPAAGTSPDTVAESGLFPAPAGSLHPPLPPRYLPRPAGEDRPATFLRDDIRARAAGPGVHVLLQTQFHPLGADPAANRAALDPSRPWPVEHHPYLTVARLRLDTVEEEAAAEELLFDPAAAPEGLGIALARSPFEPASVNHLRALVYRSVRAARTGRPAPAPASVPAHGTGAVSGGPRRSVCVIGAGASGLTAAHELERRGHRVVVLDSAPEVAGKAASLEIDGRPYDLGAHICTPRYTGLAALAREFGVGTEDVTPVLERSPGGPVRSPAGTAFFAPGTYRRYLRLRAEAFPHIGAPGLAHSAAALARPAAEWLRENGLTAMAESFAPGYTASGYGFLHGDLPALYFVKYAELTGLLDLGAGSGTGGRTGSFTVAGGFGRLWRRVAAELSDVRTGVRIEAIERNRDGVTVRTGTGEVRTDALLLTVPLDRLAGALDLTGPERDIAARVRTVDYRTVVCRVSGLPGNGFHLLSGPYDTAPPGRGGLVAHHHRHPGSDVFTCYCYGTSGMTEAELYEALGEDVARLGGRLTEVLHTVSWPFMPHFGSADLAAGVLERIEAMQGENRTYHAGSLPAFELIETNVAYVRDLVRRRIAPLHGPPHDTPAPPRPEAVREASDGRRGGPDPAEIRAWLVASTAAVLGIAADEVEPDRDLDEYGLDSLAAAEVLADLSDRLGYRVPPTLLHEFPTLEAVADRLARGR
ncbi:FAD-dependent oxidoreductase [Streptomyces sp. TRM 70361]|uniref:FAD-dependent oxidoreductase n=1 Tax=Streptomyces sp. TRM 70361 TaxID=3116553 RepID=UPI002E7B8AB3|nr:FAD-dependent oxidoreductase [Streptomyces sp. TRM 70361]MEE1937975.1 FAD-dependent oxidoreductase [Streptomyces sp. TRM 70361]